MIPFEFLYYLGCSAKKYYAFKNQKKLPNKVISIGNITVGGAGKTPAAIALASEAKKRGLTPIILTRGYKGKAKGPCFVQETKNQASWFEYQEFGDEPILMLHKLKDIPIIKCADRYEGGMFALKKLNPDSKIIFILDDGFQHWKLFRDKDILLIDATNPFGNRMLLPAGSLREPIKEIKRADVIVFTKTENLTENNKQILMNEIRKYNQNAKIFLSTHNAAGFINLSGKTISNDEVKGKDLFAFCGIANPDSFRKTLLSLGANLKGILSFRDHYSYEQQDIEKIIKKAAESKADWIVTTEKDMVKLNHLSLPENLIALSIEFSVDKGFYDEVL
jgi:tetraacyldisaccharide 4'-kinase